MAAVNEFPVKVTVTHKVSSVEMLVLENVSNTLQASELKKQLADKGYGYKSVHRIQLKTREGRILANRDTLSDIDPNCKQFTFFFSDLGPQIKFRATYIIEYTVPLIVYPIFYFRPAFLFKQVAQHSYNNIPVREIALACWVFHYVRRLIESIWVHKFSNDTMPVKSMLRNTTYYGMNAAAISYFANDPYRFWPSYGLVQVVISLVGYICCEYSNNECHLLLSNLRPAGSTKTVLPVPTSSLPTFLFNYVSCPHYFYESLAWMFFAILTEHWSGVFFWLFGTYIMSTWAIKKHKFYKKLFSNYPTNRKAIIPFLL